MLDGRGDQQFLTQKHEKNRRKALLDRTKFSDDELEELEVSFPQGGGMTRDDVYTVDQYLYPMDSTIRKRKSVDLREVDPSIGDVE